MGLSQGVRLGPYQIVAPLGAGGMGTVYKATDTRLGRAVAIKVLADRASNDPQQRLRFEQEARAVSALNHPNICVLYDVGCETPSGGRTSAGDPTTPSGPVQFLVMEHLEGETLSKRLREGGVSFDQALEIGAQVAEALAKAHRHGIVHRDLKPGNIMLTRSGTGVHAKLLDFGLAKLRMTRDPDLESTHSVHEPETRPGAVLGTLPYMAPEQLEGKPTDGRADIFSLGCVLYEMLTGHRAFRGDSEASVISAIMRHEPVPLATIKPNTPAALDHLIRRCLQKDPDLRAESAHDLAEELRWLREACRGDSNNDGHPRRRVTDPPSNSGQRQQESHGPTPRPRTRRVVFALGLLGVAVAAYAGVAYRQGWWPWSGDPFRNAVPQHVTSETGLQSDPAVSPDGKLIAYVSVPSDGGTPHIWVVGTGTGKRQMTSADEPDSDPTWDPTGTKVLFTRHRNAERVILEVPWPGGHERPVVTDASQPAVSPDGGRLAFVREIRRKGETRVFVAPLNDPLQATPVSVSGQGLWDHTHPAWSPDGQWLCYAAQHSLWKVRADGGGATRLTFDNESATDPVWSHDGKSIYYTSSREGTTALWAVAANGGTPRRLRSGSTPERQPSLSADGERLAYSTDEANLDIVLRRVATSEERRLSDTARVEMMPRFSWDRQALVFASGPSSGRSELWVQRLNGVWPTREPWQLTSHGKGEVDHPAYSTDGRWVAYYRVVNGQRDIWIVPGDGGAPARITTDSAADIEPAWSRDGTRLAFASARSNDLQIWVVSVADGHAVGGTERRVTHGEGTNLAPEWSPDSQWIAYVDQPTTRDADVWMTRADGSGDPQRVTTGAHAYRIRWVEPDRMVVSGRWGERSLSLRFVNPSTGESTPLTPPVVLGDDPWACDFDIDLDRGLAVFARYIERFGHISAVTRRR